MTSATIDGLAATIARIRDAIERNSTASADTAAGKTSEFWASIFATRGRDPDLNELMIFRRAGFAYGVGDYRHDGIEQERDYCSRTHHIFRRMVNAELVAGLPEATFGAPLVFEHDGVRRSAGHWVNAATTHRLLEFLRRFGKKEPLRVLEIGAGWGACISQLHHSREIESCVIVDLPKNLFLSTAYLSAALPERHLEFLDVAGHPINAIAPGTIAACLPGTIGRIRAPFDLVLNSFSLQEMALESVQAYVDWIADTLSENGLFVSLNSHAKAGVANPSDYRYDKFHIHHWGVFRKSPPGFFNTIPYEVVLGRRRADSPSYPSDALDALGWLIQLGLDGELEPMCAALVNGSLDARQIETLSLYNRFFAGASDDERAALLGKLELLDASPMRSFVAAHLALVRNEKKHCRRLLEESCALGLTGFARVRAEVLLAGMQRKLWRPNTLPPIDGLDVMFAYPDAAKVVTSGNLQPMIDHANRVLRRKP